MCGGTAFRASAQASARDVSRQPPAEDVQRQAEAILSAILPADLLEGHLDSNKPADDETVAELPLVKIEPHVVLRVFRKPPVATPRQLLAEAAERRAAAATAAAAVTAGAIMSEGAPVTAEETPAAAPLAAPPAVEAVLELKGTGSSFGRSLGEVGEEGVSASLVVAEPRDGSRDLTNADACRGNVVLMWRGGCSFVDKVRRAQVREERFSYRLACRPASHRH